MEIEHNLDLGSLHDILGNVPFALSLSDLSQPDQPLIYFNTAFSAMTGYTDEMIGQNCRFLQGDLDNTEARAEIREALRDSRRTQVVLENRRADGSVFRNFLRLEHLGKYPGFPEFALGAQFDLGDQKFDLEELSWSGDKRFGDLDRIRNSALRIQLERRKIATDSALRLLQSWCILKGMRGSAVRDTNA